jgi:hypothetical protein
MTLVEFPFCSLDSSPSSRYLGQHSLFVTETILTRFWGFFKIVFKMRQCYLVEFGIEMCSGPSKGKIFTKSQQEQDHHPVDLSLRHSTLLCVPTSRFFPYRPDCYVSMPIHLLIFSI